MKKYEFTEETKEFCGIILYRIRAVMDFGNVRKGDLGGYLEKESNLAQVSGNAWVYGNARVFGNAHVYGNAQVYGDARVYGNALVCDDAQVYGNARVYGDAHVCGNAWVYGDAQVSGNAHVSGDAQVSGNADYVVFKNWWSSGRYFTWTKSNDMWRVGCFFGTGKELIAKAYKDSEKSGREYERIVNYVEEIKSITL